MIEEIGFFDPRLFLIHEDTDLNLRAHLMGWNVMYVPSATVRHRVRTSIGAMSDIAAYYSLRNAEIVRLKNVPVAVFLRCLPAVAVQLVAEFLYFGVKHRKLTVYCKAKRDVFRMMPVVLRERARLMKGKRTRNACLYAMTTSVFHPDFLKEKLRKFACR
jgi:GT2 family glycosyltransferase